MPRRTRENSLAGFALALELGADGIELDVHATPDGVVVVHHDPGLADGTSIAATAWGELRRRESAPGVAIPTLGDVLELVSGRATVYVEVKGPRIEALVDAQLRTYAGEAAIHSFDHALIARLHAAGCPRPLGILFDASIDAIGRSMERTGAQHVWPRFSLVTPALVEAVHAHGGQVIAWTVNDPQVARRMTAAGVDGLCGDDITVFAAS